MARRLLLTAAVLIGVPAFAVPASGQPVVVGNAASVAGEVTLDNDELRRPIKLERRRRIAWGDIIATERNSQAQLLLLDRSTFGIGQRSRVRIDRFVYDPKRERSVFATLLKGALRFFSGEEAGVRSGEVATPAGRIGIRGTAVDMLVGERAEEIAERQDAVGRIRSDEDEATLVVLRGPAAGAGPGLAPGRVEVTGAEVTVVLDQPGLAAYIPYRGAVPVGPFRIGNGGLAKVQDELAPRWARGFGRGGIPDEVVGAAAAAVIGGILLGTRGSKDRENADANSQSTSTRVCRDAQGQPIACPQSN